MNLVKIYQNLYEYFGPQEWWPIFNKKNSDSRFEVIVGAILTQNTSWINVEKALSNLYRKKLLNIKTMSEFVGSRHASTLQIIENLIRPAGYFRQKTKKLLFFLEHIHEHHHGNLDSFLKLPLKNQREELLSLWGIGEETADSILVYASQKPSFVIDLYTKRLCSYHGVQYSSYEEYKEFFEYTLPESTKLYNEYHALIVAWGKLETKKETQKLAKKLIGVV